jgi:hypothetical protein
MELAKRFATKLVIRPYRSYDLESGVCTLPVIAEEPETRPASPSYYTSSSEEEQEETRATETEEEIYARKIAYLNRLVEYEKRLSEYILKIRKEIYTVHSDIMA